MEKNKTIPQMEVRCLSAELRADNTENRTISGYAAKFESWSEPIMGWFKEKIDQRAFEECNLSDVIMCFNHNESDILARTTSGTLTLSTDDTGLRFSFDAPITSRGNDMLELVRRGDISKCSFKFVVEKDEWRYADETNKLEYDERTILQFASLKDVSLVVFPAYKDTEASARFLEERKKEFVQNTQSKQKEVSRSNIESQSRERLVKVLRLK